MSTKHSESNRKTIGSGCLSGCGFLLFTLTFFGCIRQEAGIQIETTSQPDVISSPELENKAEVADRAVQKFHTQVNQGECQEAYKQAADSFKDTFNLSEVTYFCSEMRSQFGSVKSTVRVSQSEQQDKQGISYLVTSYVTELSSVSASETFVWLADDSQVQLAGYGMTSEPSLVLDKNKIGDFRPFSEAEK